MKVGEKVSVNITDGKHVGKTLELDVEERLGIDPAAYINVPGWNCGIEIDGETVWFFIDDSGSVWDDENDEVGLCPSQEEEYNEYNRSY